MASNSLSAYRLPANDPLFNASPSNHPASSKASPLHGPFETHGQIDGSDCANNFPLGVAVNRYSRPGHDPTQSVFGPEVYSAWCSGQLPQRHGRPPNPQEKIFESSGNRFPSVHGNLQHQPGWDFPSPPITSPFPDMSNSGQQSNVVDSPTSRKAMSVSQRKSVKHLTCYYWANNGCKLPDHICLYSHTHTGMLAEPPTQLQPGRKFSFYYL